MTALPDFSTLSKSFLLLIEVSFSENRPWRFTHLSIPYREHKHKYGFAVFLRSTTHNPNSSRTVVVVTILNHTK